MIKYIVVGDDVVSITDGQLHFISAKKLVELYKVDPKECILTDRDSLRYLAKFRFPTAEEVKVLWPLYEGNYDTFLKE